MAGLASVGLPALVLEDDDLLAAAMLDDLGIDRDARDHRLADANVAAVVGEQERVEVHLRARGPDQLFDAQGFTLRDTILLSTSLNDGVHEERCPPGERGSLG